MLREVLQCPAVEPQNPEELQQSPNPEPLHLNLFAPPPDKVSRVPDKAEGPPTSPVR